MKSATADGNYFDLQLNGYIGVDFQQKDLSVEDFHCACEAVARDGCSGFLATIITESIDVMCARLARIVELREGHDLARRMIPGIHIEGPFLSPERGYRGAHPLDAIHPANIDEIKRLLDAAGGLTRLFTLDPDHDAGFAATRYLADQGITVSAGHTDASIDVLRGAIDHGLSMVTHVGNGCPGQMHRHDNITQRALSLRDDLWLCFIGDGVHVPFFALDNYIHVAGDRAVMVTDAMPAAGLGKGTFTIGRWTVEVGDDMAAWAPDRTHLLGAVVTMAQTATNLREQLGLSDQDVHRLLVTNPRRAVGLQ